LPGDIVLTDYAGTSPCTKMSADDEFPASIDPSVVNASNGAWYVRDLFTQGHDTRVPDNAVYDGVFVRSPFRRAAAQNFHVPTISGAFATNVPKPTRIAKITDGTSKTMMISEKYIRADLYPGGYASDDRGWTDGWDPDVMRCTCIQPINDGDVNPVHSPQPPNVENASFFTLIMGSSHPGGINAVFADGSVHTVSYDVNVYILNALGTRNGTSAGPGGPMDPEVIDTATGAN
jgi:prepilin-type processing-associated H-X9-DG protein